MGQWIMARGTDDSKAIGRQTTRREEGGGGHDAGRLVSGGWHDVNWGGAIMHAGGRAGGHTTIKKRWWRKWLDDGNAMGNNQKTMVEERWLDDGNAVVQYLQMARWRQ
jgi:hypothetical protein